MPASLMTTAAMLKRDEKGSVAILFGLTAVVATMFAGLSIDMGRAYTSKSMVAAAADAAVLAAAKGMRLEGLSQEQAETLGENVFIENMKAGSNRWTDVHTVRVTADTATGSAQINVNASVKTTFTALSGVSKLDVLHAANAVFEKKDIEVAVQLDMTGSMCDPCTKIADLKVATLDLVKILVPETPSAGQTVRVGFAPFSAGVNVGPYFNKVASGSGKDTCVYERQSKLNETTDAAPFGLDQFKTKADLIGSVQNCPTAKITPLTNVRKTLTDAIDKFKTGSSTAGQLGAAWAWHLVSPSWKTVWPKDSAPAEYNDTGSEKIVILMTDGVYNTIGGVNYGDTSAQATTASDISVELCTNMKREGITIYTVGFDFASIKNSSARHRAEDTLTACAGKKDSSIKDGYAYQASDRKELRAAFANIAQNIVQLRLTN